MAKTVVVDASVAVKWFLKEEYSDISLELLKGHVGGSLTLAAPALLHYEVLNALRYSRIFDAERLARIAKILDDLQLALYSLAGELAVLTARTAYELDVTIYDASYIALSRRLGAHLITADEEITTKYNYAIHISKIKDVL
ncbi:MAG: type II toxin-antitoxin system VapC family toxin [Pyrobaculum sp.]